MTTAIQRQLAKNIEARANGNTNSGATFIERVITTAGRQLTGVVNGVSKATQDVVLEIKDASESRRDQGYWF